MYEVVGVKFESSNRLYFFEINSLSLKKGDKVVVETEKGVQFGEVSTDIKSIEEKHLSTPLKKVIRLANKEDIDHYKINAIKNVTDKASYTINFSLVKDNKKWVLEKITDSDLEKIHGLYED